MLYELARALRYPRLQAFYRLSEAQIYGYVGFLHEVAEVVELNPMLIVPIRDVYDVIVVQTAVIGEAEILCTTDNDFYDPATSSFLNENGILLMDDIDLMRRLKSAE